MSETTYRERRIFCIGCNSDVRARLTDGSEVYPNHPHLHKLPFWKCDICKGFVGTHHATRDRVRPLGFIATPEVKKWRRIIHGILDPLWKGKKIERGQAYLYVSNRIGRTYHTAEIYSVDEAKRIYEIVKELKMKLDPSPWNR